MSESNTYNDYPKDVLIAGAEEALAQHRAQGIEAHVYFKATCPECGERPLFQEPDTCFATMECGCGCVFPFTKGNYMLIMGGPIGGDDVA
jgi:hypothetical protein